VIPKPPDKSDPNHTRTSFKILECSSDIDSPPLNKHLDQLAKNFTQQEQINKTIINIKKKIIAEIIGLLEDQHFTIHEHKIDSQGRICDLLIETPEDSNNNTALHAIRRLITQALENTCLEIEINTENDSSEEVLTSNDGYFFLRLILYKKY